MKNGIFYTKFLFVLLGLIGFMNIKAMDPVILYPKNATIYHMTPDNSGSPQSLTATAGANAGQVWLAYQGQPAHGSYLEWNNVNVETAGTYNFTLQYAAVADQYASLKINNQIPTALYFGEGDYSSNANTNDGAKTWQIYLNAGNNKIRLSAFQNEGNTDDNYSRCFTPLIDKATITQSDIDIDKLPDEYTVTIPAQNTTERVGNWVNADYPATGFHGVGGATTGYLKYNVNIPEGEEGVYNMVVSYACGWDDHYISPAINEGTVNQVTQTIRVPGSGPDTWGNGNGWEGLLTYQMMTQCYLTAGDNSIRFVANSDGSAYPNISQFQLIRFNKEFTSEFPIVIYAQYADDQYMMFPPDLRTYGGVTWIGLGGDAKSLYGSYLQFNITVSNAGVYDMIMKYAACDDRTVSLKVNNQVSTLINIGKDDYSSDWQANNGTKTVQVYLEAGDNSVTIGAYQVDDPTDNQKWNMPVFDRFVINPSGTNITKLPDAYSFTQNVQEPVESTGDWKNVDKTAVDFHGIGGSEDGYVLYNVNVPSGKGGQYTLVIDYMTAEDRYFTLITNEGTENEFSYEFKTPSNGTWGDVPDENIYGLSTYKVMALVNLTNGNNTVKLVADGSYVPDIGNMTFIKYGEYAPDVVTGIVKPSKPDGVSVYGLSGKIVISSPVQANYTVYDMTGKIAASGTSSSSEKYIPVDSGLYVVKVNNVVKKVIVK